VYRLGLPIPGVRVDPSSPVTANVLPLEHICARPLPHMTQRTMAVGKGPPSQIGC